MEKSPAFCMPQAGANWFYQIDHRDALIWLQLPREMRARGKALYLGFLVAGGIGFALFEDQLPDGFAQLPSIVAVILLVIGMQGIWIVGHNLWTRRKARRMIPYPADCVLDVWSNHLGLQMAGAVRDVWPEATRQVVTLPGHVFIDDLGGVVIVPLAAFGGDRAAMADFAASWDRLSAEAAP